MDTQVLTSDLAESLDMAGQRGVRVTEVFKGQAADKAGVKVGDIILDVNGRKGHASLPGDGEVFDAMVRRLPLGEQGQAEDHPRRQADGDRHGPGIAARERRRRQADDRRRFRVQPPAS